MGAPALFAIASLIWGSTWIAITFQLGSVAAEASVVYRFALASLLVAVWCIATRRNLKFSLSQHGWLAAQGTLLFGVNYLGVYWSEQYVASGLVAVIFSLIVFFNLIGARLFFAAPATGRTLVAAALGIIGVVVMFWPEVSARSGNATLGAGIALASTVLASGGNMVALRNQRHGFPLLPSVAWAMGYGALAITVVAAMEGTHWNFEPSARYVLSLVYLTIFGSVIAFLTYLTLLAKIGPARAGYVGVAVTVVALAFSTLFEHYAWTTSALLGAALCVAGNILVLMRDSPGRATRDG